MLSPSICNCNVLLLASNQVSSFPVSNEKTVCERVLLDLRSNSLYDAENLSDVLETIMDQFNPPWLPSAIISLDVFPPPPSQVPLLQLWTCQVSFKTGWFVDLNSKI